MILILCIVMWINYSIARRVEYCFANEGVINLGFGVKTPYKFVSNGRIEKPSIPNCKASQIWMLSRHGTRYPEHSAIRRLKKLPEVLRQIIDSHEVQKRGNLCDEDLRRLKHWYPDRHMTEDYANTLTLSGYYEGEELGKRLKDAYPELFDVWRDDFAVDNYVFRSKKEARIESSMEALIMGLFESEVHWEPPAAPEPDNTLQPNTDCSKWLTRKEFIHVEREGFINGLNYAELRNNVSERLGFEVSPGTIHNMQDMCRFETAWSPYKLSPWCAVFSKSEWKMLEYIDDLHYYYSAGYGYQNNSLLGCSALQDLYENFRKLENETDGKLKGIFNFSDSKFLIYFLHALGISKDGENLLASNFEQMTKRKWKTSEISPFLGNIVATFHRCSDSAIKNKVTFHLNEKLVMYEGCESGICDWKYLKSKFETFLNACQTNCGEETNQQLFTDSADLSLLIIMIIVLVFSMRTVIANVLSKIGITKLRRSTFKL